MRDLGHAARTLRASSLPQWGALSRGSVRHRAERALAAVQRSVIGLTLWARGSRSHGSARRPGAICRTAGVMHLRAGRFRRNLSA
jgi:hypothetical protein